MRTDRWSRQRGWHIHAPSSKSTRQNPRSDVTNLPASTNSEDRDSNEYLGQLTQVIDNRTVNEVEVGFAEWNRLLSSHFLLFFVPPILDRLSKKA
jgi:hypothetical protein